MYMERIAKLTTAMQAQGIHALAIVPGASMRYLTGLVFHPGKRLTLVVFPADGAQPRMVLPAMEVAQSQAVTRWGGSEAAALRFFPWNDGEDPTVALQEAVAQVVANSGTAAPVIGVEYSTMRVMELRALEAVLPGMRTVDATPLLASLRRVKDKDELGLMAEAVRIIEIALRNTIVQIKPGMTERQVAAIWKHAIMANGAEGESFDCMVASGPHSANPHHQNSERALQVGDLVILDGGAVYAGYASDITRTVALGSISSEAQRVYELVLAANTAARGAVRPGITGEQVDQVARQVITDGGYGNYFLHRTGHGLGMDVHEAPYIVAGNTEPLVVGNTFTIEPGIYVEGVGGVRIEDDMVVTAAGGHSLTTFERELITLPV